MEQKVTVYVFLLLYFHQRIRSFMSLCILARIREEFLMELVLTGFLGIGLQKQVWLIMAHG